MELGQLNRLKSQRVEKASFSETLVLGVALGVRKRCQWPRMSSKLVTVDQDVTGRNGGSKMDIVSGRKKIE